MTPLQLLDALEAFVKQETKDILLPVRVDRKSGENKERAAEVYKMRLPNKTAQTERVPYLLLQYIKSTDTQEQGQDPESECIVRIVAATYHADGELCRMYTAEEFTALTQAATAHVFYHRTYCNHLNAWIKRAGLDEIPAIVYGVDLPADLAASMAALIEKAGGDA